MSKFGVALQLPPTTSPPFSLSLSPLQLSACSIVRSYFACRKVAPKCCLSLPVVVLQLPSPAFAAIAACRRVALSHCRLAAWLVGILNNLPHACKFPLARHWALGDCRGRRHGRVRAASPTWSLSHISHAAAITAAAAAAADGAVPAAAATCHSCGNVNCLHKWPGHNNRRSWPQVKEPSVSAGLKCFINT